jgi:hypothetical protein
MKGRRHFYQANFLHELTPAKAFFPSCWATLALAGINKSQLVVAATIFTRGKI